MACKGCADRKAEREANKKSYGIIDYAKAKLSGKVDDLTSKVRLAVCKTCIHRDQDTGQRLFRVIDGKFYCGEPRIFGSLYRDDVRVGCGCDLEEKCSYVESKCPRRSWGPGDRLSHNIKVLKQAPKESLKGVIDIIGGGGIGDIMVHGSIYNGLKAKYPNHRVRAVVKTDLQAEWMRLMVDDVVIDNGIDHNVGEFCYTTQKETFEHEDAKALKAGWNRHQQFASNSLIEPVPVTLRHSENALLKAQNRLNEPLADGKKIIFLAPFASWPIRNWPLSYWVELCVRLQDSGYWVGVLDAIQGEERTKPFPCMRYWGLPADEVIGLLEYSDLIIGNDSGMAHIGGSLNKLTLALCGPNLGSVVYGFYKSVKVLQATKNCSMCNFMKDHGLKYSCAVGCEALYELKVDTVLHEIKSLLQYNQIYTGNHNNGKKTNTI